MSLRRDNTKAEADARLAKACGELVGRRPGDGSSDAEDAAQEACIRALELDQPQKIIDPLRYIQRIARNLFVDIRRRSNREARLFEYSENAGLNAPDRVDPERVLAGKQRLAGILQAIDQLPPRCREAFTLHRFENLNYAAIGQRMGISISMVEKHMAEAMTRLSRALQQGDGA